MELLYVLLVLLAVTRLLGEAALRLGQPALLGELIGGVVVGTVVHAFPATFPTLAGLAQDPEFHAVTDLGVFFLMLLAGLEMHPRELTEGSMTSMLVAAGGLLLPLLLGVGLAWVVVPASPARLAQSIFLGTAVAITAVPVAIKILMDLGKLDSPIGKTIVAAALVDDILSLILLSVLTALIRTGDMVSLEQQGLLVAKVAFFLVCTSAVGVWVLPRLAKLVMGLESVEVELSLLVVVGLAFAVFAEAMGMHFIIGAFLAGLFFSARTLSEKTYGAVSSQVSGLTNGLLAPIFFASIGLHLELDVVVEAPLFVGALLLVAIVGKVVGAGGAALACGFAPRASMAIGAAMSARGAVELIVADVAMRGGLFERPDPPPPIIAQMFSAVVLMAIVTTLLAPIALRVILRDARDDGD